MANKLYNGIELPDIDTVWTDKETCPYAVILYRGAYTGMYTLMITSGECVYNSDYGSGTVTGALQAETENNIRWYSYDPENNSEWVFVYEYADMTGTLAQTELDAPEKFVVWATYDVVDIATGNVIREGDEPEPETPEAAPVSPYICINGAWAKHDIYKQVGNSWVKQPQGAVEVEGGAWSALS